MKTITVKAVQKYLIGYEVRTELEEVDEHANGPILIRRAYNTKGEFIGSPWMAHHLIVAWGIMPEKIEQADEMCSIGFCKRENKWYGWSYQAISGFGVGSTIYDETKQDPDCPEKTTTKIIETLEEAKQAAICFVRNLKC